MERSNSQTLQSQKLWRLIVIRLIVSFFLLLSSALWEWKWPSGLNSSFRRETMLIVFGVILLSLVYSLVLRMSNRLELQARVQLFIDVLLVTWIVWLTGDARSPYVVLYTIVIAGVGIFLGAVDALIIAVFCASSFTLLTTATVTGLIKPYSQGLGPLDLPEAIQKIGLNDVAFFVVGLLAARFAERRSKSDVSLIAATHALAKLRALHERIIESIGSGVVTTDLHGRIYTFNRAAEEITGYTLNDVIGKEASFFFGEDIGKMIDKSLQTTKQGGQSPRFESECVTPDGMRLRLGFTIFPLASESNQVTGLVITFQDLTDIRALEDLSRRQDRLAAVGRVAAGIAHEIRNPLASMRGSIQVLRSEFDTNPLATELMEIILRESDRLNRIITDFLIYARPRPCNFEETDLRVPLRETFALLRNSPEMNKNQEIVEDLPSEPLIAMVDSEQLRQVFWNLSRNALQAMLDGGTLRVSMDQTPTGRVIVTFADTGCGMTSEQVERLFEPFSSSTPGGTGLGLSIVYQIVRDHGGTINARSRQGSGTTITIELPGVTINRATTKARSIVDIALQ
jgi:two-component system, NtrC family, sensor histidine kinase PilS